MVVHRHSTLAALFLGAAVLLGVGTEARRHHGSRHLDMRHRHGLAPRHHSDSHRHHHGHGERRHHGVSLRQDRYEGSRHRHHSQSHEHEQREHQRKWSHKRGIHLVEDDMSVKAAENRMPAKALAAFKEARKAPADAAKATDALKQLGVVYERAQADKDMLTIDCKDKKEGLANEVKSARMTLMVVEAQLTRTTNRMQSLQSKMDSSLAQIEGIRSQYSTHKTMCERNRKQSDIQLGFLMTDLPAAKAFVDAATAGCGAAGGTPPALVQCTLPDGTEIVTFEQVASRDAVAKLSSTAEWFMSLNLKRAAYPEGVGAPATSFLEMGARSKAGTGLPMENASRPLTLLAHRALPKDLCKPAKKPACESFGDVMVTFLGNIQDSIDDIRERQQLEDDHCSKSLEEYESQIRELREFADDANVMFANAAAEAEDLEKQRKTSRALLKDVHGKADKTLGQCGRQLEVAEEMMCGAKKLRTELKKIEAKTSGGFEGDCVVTDWIRGPCTALCNGGFQNLTREIVSKPAKDAKCPKLMLTRRCNERVCPVDCKMDRWDEWTECSRACGGGAQSRHRAIIQEAENGGEPCGESTQERLCNIEPCDSDCSLTEWTEWSTCSKACLSGHQTRVKHVLHPALGDGACPTEHSMDRREAKRCNDVDCKSQTPTCASMIDLVLVLDGSGSVKEAGWKKVQEFATTLLGKIKFGEEHAKVGLVQFSTSAKMLSGLTADKAEAEKAVAAMTWLKGATNTAEALVLAREIFLNGRKGAKGVVVVITDGMPTSKYLATTAVTRVKEQAARVSFVAVGSSVNERVLAHWASWPARENVVKVSSFEKLDASKVTELVTSICPVLE